MGNSMGSYQDRGSSEDEEDQMPFDSEEIFYNFEREISDPLTSVFGGNKTKSDDKRSSLINLAALCGIRAHVNDVPGFQIDAKMNDGDFSHVALTYEKKGIDESSGRATRIYMLENTGGASSDFLQQSTANNNDGDAHRFKKYFEHYRKVEKELRNIGGSTELESYVVCSNNEFLHGKRADHFVCNELMLVNAGKDNLLMTNLSTFKGDFEGRRELVMHLKDCCVDLPQNFADSVLGNQNLARQTIDTELRESYWNALTCEVIDPDLMRFRKGFLDGKELSPSATHYRERLWFRYMDSEDSAVSGRREEAFKSFLASRVVQLPNITRGKIHNEGKEASPEAMAMYFTDLIARSPDKRVVKLGKSDVHAQDFVDRFLDRVFVRVVGGITFRESFFNGEELEWELTSFRNFLKDGLGSLGMGLHDLCRYTIQLDAVRCLEEASSLLEQEVMKFLEKLKLCFNHPGYETIQKSVEEEMSTCLHKLVAKSATDKFMGIVSSGIEQGSSITEANIRKFLDNIMLDYGNMYVFTPVNSELGYVTKERDVASTCICKSCQSGRSKGTSCSARRIETDSPKFPDGEDAFIFLRKYTGFVHECLVRRFGRSAMKTRGIRMNLAFHMTVVGEYQAALDLTEGEIDYGYDETSRKIANGFRHVRGRALLGLGRDKECVEHLFGSCIESFFPTLEINAQAFRATINIIYDLVCKGRYEIARIILGKLLSTNLIPKRCYTKPLHCGSNGAFFDLGAHFDVRIISSRQLALVIFEWCTLEGGSKKEALEILKIIHQFFKAFLGAEAFGTLRIKFLFAKLYCRKARGHALRKGLQYLLELRRSLCGVTESDDDNVLDLLNSVHSLILMTGGAETCVKAMKESHAWAEKTLKKEHPFTQNIVEEINKLMLSVACVNRALKTIRPGMDSFN